MESRLRYELPMDASSHLKLPPPLSTHATGLAEQLSGVYCLCILFLSQTPASVFPDKTYVWQCKLAQTGCVRSKGVDTACSCKHGQCVPFSRLHAAGHGTYVLNRAPVSRIFGGLSTS